MRSIAFLTGIFVLATLAAVVTFTIYRGYVLFSKEASVIEGLRSEHSVYWAPNDPRGEDIRRAYTVGEAHEYTTNFLEETELGYYQTPPATKFIGTSTYPSYTVITDPAGFRVARPREAPKTVDILAVGGSHTWGQGLDYEETFPAIVANNTNLVLGNAGVGRYSGVESLRRLEKFLHMKPKFIIYGFFEDHICRNIEPGHPGKTMLALFDGGGEFYIRQDVINTVGNRFVPNFLRWIDSDFLNTYFFQMKRDFIIATAGRVKDQNIVDRFNLGGRPKYLDFEMLPLMVHGQSYVLREMNARARSVGAHLIVVYFPIRPGKMITPDEWRLLAFNEKFTWIDITPFVRGKPRNEIAIGDGHYNARVNAYMASRIVNEIKNLK